MSLRGADREGEHGADSADNHQHNHDRHITYPVPVHTRAQQVILELRGRSSIELPTSWTNIYNCLYLAVTA